MNAVPVGRSNSDINYSNNILLFYLKYFCIDRLAVTVCVILYKLNEISILNGVTLLKKCIFCLFS